MAAPYDTTIHTRLSALNKVFKEQYFDDLLLPVHCSGMSTARMFQFDATLITGDGRTLKINRAKSSPVSATRAALAEFGDAAPLTIDSEIKVRFHQTDSTANDIGRLSGAVQVTHFDMKNGGKGAIIDLAERLQKDFREDFPWKTAVLRNTGRTGILCYINQSSIKQNDGMYIGDCAAYSSGGTSFRASLDNGTVARLKPGLLVDIVNSSGTVVADKLMVTDVRPEDPAGASAGFATTTNSTITNCDGVADNQYVVISGSYNDCPWTVEDWMNPPTGAATTTDSFIGGVNRHAVGYRQLVPMTMRKGQSAQQISESHLDDLGIARHYLMDDSEVSMIRLNGELMQTLRRQIQAAAFIQWPSDTDKRKRYAHLGTSGLTYQSPQLGLVSFQTDPMMSADKFDCYSVDDWTECNYGKRGIEILPGNTEGFWTRMNSTTPGGGQTLVYRMEAMQLLCDFCSRPFKQARVLNLTA